MSPDTWHLNLMEAMKMQSHLFWQEKNVSLLEAATILSYLKKQTLKQSSDTGVMIVTGMMQEQLEQAPSQQTMQQ